MAKGPPYSEDEDALLNRLAKKGGSPTELAAEFIELSSGETRTAEAVAQRLRKMILASGIKTTKGVKKAKTAKVNAVPLSDAPPAKKRGRPPKNGVTTAVPAAPIANSNGYASSLLNGSLEVSVDLGGGLRLVGSKRRVGEALQQLG